MNEHEPPLSAEEEGFEILGEIVDIERLAVRRSIRVLRWLNRRFGRGRWRKLKGRAMVRLQDGWVGEVEVHWYEAHGIGRRRMKVKRP